jgi:transcription-repair coupling factor (superfamily II helicase)
MPQFPNQLTFMLRTCCVTTIDVLAPILGLDNAVHDCVMRLRHDVRIDVDSVREGIVCDGLERAKSVRRNGKRSVRGSIAAILSVLEHRIVRVRIVLQQVVCRKLQNRAMQM